jgi:hypothetical protein
MIISYLTHQESPHSAAKKKLGSLGLGEVNLLMLDFMMSNEDEKGLKYCYY